MKKLTVILILALAAVTAKAQEHAGATQTTNLALSDIIDIGFANAAAVNLEFNTVNDYANGVESGEQTLVIRSNTKFNIRVKAQAPKFTYTGTATDPQMKVKDVLQMKISGNNTGGTITSGYSSYKSVSTSNNKIINQGQPGGNKSISIKYKAAPGFEFPAGSYTVDIVYTASKA